MGKSSRTGFGARLKREVRFVSGLYRTLRRLKGVSPTSNWLICDDLEAAADKHSQRTAITFEGRSLTYGQLDAMANRFAHWANGRGIKKGDTVALFMPNRIEYVAIWFGLSKVGVATALINNNLAGAALCHCLKISGAAHVIADGETAPAFEAVRADLGRKMTEWIVGGAAPTADRDLDRALKGVSSLRPTRETARYGLTAKDVALYIYTSGTTGCPRRRRSPTCGPRATYGASPARPGPGRSTASTASCRSIMRRGGLCAVGAALFERRRADFEEEVLRQPVLARHGRAPLHHVRLYRRALPLSGEPARTV